MAAPMSRSCSTRSLVQKAYSPKFSQNLSPPYDGDRFGETGEAAVAPVEGAGLGDHAGDGRAVPADELRGRVDDDVGAVLDRPAEVRRGQRGVDDQRQVLGVGDVGQGGDVGHRARRVGHDLRVEQLRLGPDGGGEAPWGRPGRRRSSRCRGGAASRRRACGCRRRGRSSTRRARRPGPGRRRSSARRPCRSWPPPPRSPLPGWRGAPRRTPRWGWRCGCRCSRTSGGRRGRRRRRCPRRRSSSSGRSAPAAPRWSDRAAPRRARTCVRKPH